MGAGWVGSVPPGINKGGKSIKVDWCSASLDADALDSVVEVLEACMPGVEVGLVHEAGGWLAFSRRAKIVADGALKCGVVAWGGESQRGRMLVSLTGVGCSLVSSWAPLVDLLHLWGGRITRADIAADFFDGALQVDDALQAFHEGRFCGRGRKPCGQLVDDLGSGKGRTLYVGSGERMVRVYEKDKETGGAKVGPSDWVRVELQQRRGDREVPIDALLEPEAYFAGAYPILGEWLGKAGRRMEYLRRSVVDSVSRAVSVARQQAGAVVGFLTRRGGLSSSQVVSLLQRAPNERMNALTPAARVVSVEVEFFDPFGVGSDELLGGGNEGF